MRPASEVPDSPDYSTKDDVKIVAPTIDDGAAVWRIAQDSRTLDLNSSYAYLLFCHDFSETCRIAVINGETAGFVLGYRQPKRPQSLFVWQIAVDEKFRGRGLAGALLDGVAGELVASGAVSTLETTITDDNLASQQLFISFAKRWGDASVTKEPLFELAQFPNEAQLPNETGADGQSPTEHSSTTHSAEPLYRIGPLRPAVALPDERRTV